VHTVVVFVLGKLGVRFWIELAADSVVSVVKFFEKRKKKQ
jgi:hypothetical protein